MRTNPASRLKQLRRNYLLVRLAEVVCLGVAAGLTVAALSRLAGLSGSDALVLGVILGLVLTLGQVYKLGLHQLNVGRMASFVNRRHPELQWSADLLVHEGPHRGLEALQAQKAASLIETISPFQFPHRLTLSIAALAAGAMAVWSVSHFQNELTTTDNAIRMANPNGNMQPAMVMPIALKRLASTVTPPAYTGLDAVNFEQGDMKVAEGSRIKWHITFSARPEQAFLVVSGTDTLKLSGDGSEYSGQYDVQRSGFYQVSWSDQGQMKSSAYFKLEVTEDAAPVVAVAGIPQFQQFNWNDDLRVPFAADLKDDYGLTDAYIVATVSKGSGESVKFREEKLLFDSPAKVAGRALKANKTIDLRKMRMEPGDELYFYVEAWDNKRPQRQSARTETYFLQITDTASYIVSSDGGLGVDLMPEYFRSQRQIIIDSEKLVSDRGKVKKKDFDDRSNSLAHDQKVLRLRYGQFLGEEFESGITQVESHQQEESAPVTQEEAERQFGHVHDTENEHNLVPGEEHHDHETAPLNPEAKEDPIEAFAHMHDSEEEATFFIQSVKTKLRAALSMMWDAELHLRMNRPEESLPYQYKILQLLKEISNDSRIYVHRTGFDAPPIKEDKRLTGDLKEVDPARRQYTRMEDERFQATKEAVAIIEKYLLKPGLLLAEEERALLQLAGNEMAGGAIENPGRYLESMDLLRQLIEGRNPLNVKELLTIRKSMFELLPERKAAVTARPRSLHNSDRELLKKVEVMKNE